MWSHVFMHHEGEKKTAIILLETRGVFQKQSSNNYESILALSTLISSVQIYNFWENVQENHLHSLKLFSEYDKKAQEPDSKPFQLLQILVRDWVSNDTYDYGAGGIEMLDGYLDSIANQLGILKTDREAMSLRFSEVDCFLMPHPGFDFLSNPIFNENSMRNEFKNNLKEFVTSILSPNKLKAKVMKGQQMSGGELVIYLKNYLAASAEARLIMSEGKYLYIEEIKKIYEGSYLSESQFNVKDNKIRQDCLQWVSTYEITFR